MAYVTPTSKTTGSLITDVTWNQDVVDNFIALRSLANVQVTIIAEQQTSDYALSSATWTTRRLNTTVRDPNGIIDAEDYGNYQFDLLDGTYRTEIFSWSYLGNGVVSVARLRDVDNNETLAVTQGAIKQGDDSGSSNGEVENYTYNEFVLDNGSATTIQLQNYTTAAATALLMSSQDTDNAGNYGVWNSVVKLWKIA